MSFTVPTGNFGDIFAGFIAKEMGLPVERLDLAAIGQLTFRPPDAQRWSVQLRWREPKTWFSSRSTNSFW